MTAEVQQCQSDACDLDLDQEIRSKFTVHEISIGTAAFRFATPIGGLLVFSFSVIAKLMGLVVICNARLHEDATLNGCHAERHHSGHRRLQQLTSSASTAGLGRSVDSDNIITIHHNNISSDNNADVAAAGVNDNDDDECHVTEDYDEIHEYIEITV